MKKEDQNKPEASFMYWRGLAAAVIVDNTQAAGMCINMSDITKEAVEDRLVQSNLITLRLNCNVPLLDIVTICKFGAEKYGFNNYASEGADIKRYLDAIGRHLLKHIDGETHDEDTGLSHFCHIAANCLILLELITYKEYTNSLSKYKDGWWTG